jgi:glycine cleavage system H protein
VSGEVVEVNENLKDAPEKLNADPHGEAWLVRIRLAGPGDLEDLMGAAEYLAYVGS